MKSETIIITGASKGIGLAISKVFANEGKKILLCARNEKDLEAAQSVLIKSNPLIACEYFIADLGNKNEVFNFSEWCLQQGTPSILVNNAGTYVPGNVATEADGAMEKMMDTNFYSAYYLTRALLPAMIEKESGHIFNICSIAALQAYEGGGGYSISKFAMDGFSKNLRHELKDKNIKVTTIYPGAVLTDSWAGYNNSNKRIMEANDIAAMVKAATTLSMQAVVEEIVIRPQKGDL